MVPYVRDALESDVPLVINAVVQELAAKAEEKIDDKIEPGEELERLRVKILQEYDDMCRDMEKDDKIYWYCSQSCCLFSHPCPTVLSRHAGGTSRALGVCSGMPTRCCTHALSTH